MTTPTPLRSLPADWRAKAKQTHFRRADIYLECAAELEAAWSQTTAPADEIRAAGAAERERCARIAEAQVDSIEHELPDGSGGSWTRKFGANVARSIAAAIRAAPEQTP